MQKESTPPLAKTEALVQPPVSQQQQQQQSQVSHQMPYQTPQTQHKQAHPIHVGMHVHNLRIFTQKQNLPEPRYERIRMPQVSNNLSARPLGGLLGPVG